MSRVAVDRYVPDDKLLFPRIVRDSYPALWAWIRHFEDLSGVQGDAVYDGEEVVARLLQFAGQVYLPFLRANSSAIERGEKEVKVSFTVQ